MNRSFALIPLILWGLAWPLTTRAQQEPEWEITPLDDQGVLEYEFDQGIVRSTNGVLIKYGEAILTAERVEVNQKTGEAIADGQVRIQRQEQVWQGEHILYNFKNRQMQAEEFRTGKAGVFASGQGLAADVTNQTYFATNALITTDDSSHPLLKVRAKFIRIIPGKRFEARQATLVLGNVPVFYFPFYSRNLAPGANNFSFLPGYRTAYGPFLLSSYTWHIAEFLDADLHLDYRQKRGIGTGPDLDYHLGRWGEGTARYYFVDDADPNASLTNALPHHRQRVWFSYQSMPFTNLEVRSMVRYQTDLGVVHDFFEGEYRHNPQPSTFFEANKFWQNFSLDAYAQPRVNDFLETVERLPDIRFTGYRQQLWETPVYYESQSSAGYYRRLFPETNGLAIQLEYEAARADTYQELLLPQTFFGWLNVTPWVGGRFTYYSHATGPGAQTDEVYRGIFNTGAEVSFKASRVWPGMQSKLFHLDGLRHIVQPSVNYAFVPAPNRRGTNEIPQFDYELPSLRLLPLEFPDYNAIDTINSQNTLRFGLNNKLQTKRDGAVVNLLDWDVYTDWLLKPRDEQTTFADLFSDATFRPHRWITLESLTRYDIDRGTWRMAFHTLTLQTSDVWSWSIGHFYLRDDFRASPIALGQGNNLITSSLFFRLNENYGFRMTHRFEARDSRLEEQYYTVYRDFRSWTGALTLRLRENRVGEDDVTVAFTFSLKASPKYRVGEDTSQPYTLLGGY